MARFMPEGYHSVQAYVALKDAGKAIDFYKKAFAATEGFVMPGPRGQGVMHAELKIGDSVIMVADEKPDKGYRGVESYGGSPVAFYLYVENVDESFKKAVSAGAKETAPVADAFWGDRTGTVKDPFGLSWTLATHVKDLSPDEIRKGAEAAMAQGAQA